MSVFLLQTVGNRVRHDFVFEMEHAIDYQNWRGNEMKADYCELENINSITDNIENIVPIGTVEFVHSFIDEHIKQNGSQEIQPLNVPHELIYYTGRKVCNYILTENGRYYVLEHFEHDCDKKNADVFIKSNDKIKSPLNGWYKMDDVLDRDKLPDGKYQISTHIDIISEYRCFVYKDELRGIQYYSGDFTRYPNIQTIKDIMKKYYWDFGEGKAPQAYTLDVAITGEGETVVMECHEFYSCGLYGFNDYSVLPYMFIRTFNDIKKRILNG